MLKDLIILWLDDQRDPYKYFNKKSTSGAFIRNSEYYRNNIFSKYNVKFVWVKNINEFTSYIKQNGLPQFISFDRDLTPKGFPKNQKFPSGEDCALWLVNYCKQTNQCLPNFFVHSANINGQRNIINIMNKTISETKKIKITEKQLHEIIVKSLKLILDLF